MRHDIIGLPAFTVIGLERTGSVCTAFEWVPGLWAETTRRTNEVRHLSIDGCWGLMSDKDEFLAPWQDQGRYLAGWQVPRGTEPIGDWQVWNVPTSTWLRIALRIDQYDQAFAFLHGQFLPAGPWKQNGAAHEFYPREFQDPKTDELMLCVPLAPKD